MDFERHNHRQIEMLNQRGGRTLSVVDLIQAGTISAPMAACAMRAVYEGASILTGARPGGAGKTTLLAAVLSFLPAGEEIVTVDGPEVVTASEKQEEAGAAAPAYGLTAMAEPRSRRRFPWKSVSHVFIQISETQGTRPGKLRRLPSRPFCLRCSMSGGEQQ